MVKQGMYIVVVLLMCGLMTSPLGLLSFMSKVFTLCTQFNCYLQELVTSLERSRESLASDLANTSAQVQTLQEELKTLPVVRNNLQVSSKIQTL